MVITLTREVKEAQIMVERIRDAHRCIWHDAARERSITTRGELSALNDSELVWKFLNAGEKPLKDNMPHSFKPPFESCIEQEATILKLVSDKLSKLVRFERRAANQLDKDLRPLAQIEKISE
jgi:hypothetical protein